MEPKRILITGGSGLLALNWACALRERCEVVLATHRRRVELARTTACSIPLDRTEPLTREFEQLAPELIVHTAGLTDVDQCEREPGHAHEANAVLARNVALAAARAGARLIHISTDHLFAGTRARYQESDTPEPLNVYARTKLLAEQWVMEAHPDALVVRTNFFGWGHRFRQSFSDWIIGRLARAESITLFDDVNFTPILADRLALAAHRLLEQRLAGVVNVVGDERLSKYEFGVRLARAFGLPDAPIRRGRISESRLAAPRPRDISLDNRKARLALGADLGTPENYFAELRRQQVSGRMSELLQAVSAD